MSCDRVGIALVPYAPLSIQTSLYLRYTCGQPEKEEYFHRKIHLVYQKVNSSHLTGENVLFL